MTFSNQGNKTPYCPRGGRYYRKKLSAANISEFFKLSANYRYRKLDSILFNKHNWKHCSKNRLTEKQHKSCSLPETFVAAKPTQTMVPDINLLWEAQLASMSNKMCGGFAVDENIVEYSAFGLTGVEPNDDEGEGGIILKAPTKFCDKGVRS